jgi:hypothetical protein
MYNTPQAPAPGTLATSPVKPRRRWPWVVGVVLAFGLGAAVGGAGNTRTTAAQGTASGKATVTVTAPAPAPGTVTAPAPVTAPPAAPDTGGTISDGTHHVGEDMKAGRWKTTGPTTGMPCYWARLKNDSGDFAAIITNGTPTGPASLTVKAGEFVEFSGGCVWSPA